jgi:hypothetical protein
MSARLQIAVIPVDLNQAEIENFEQIATPSRPLIQARQIVGHG